MSVGTYLSLQMELKHYSREIFLSKGLYCDGVRCVIASTQWDNFQVVKDFKQKTQTGIMSVCM